MIKLLTQRKKPTAAGRIEKSKTPVKLTYGKPQVASMEKQSNGFWPTVEHLMGYEKLSYGQCFNRTIFVGAYNKRQDFWVEDNNVVAKYCTLHSRNEMNLLRAEVERIVGELLLVEKMVISLTGNVSLYMTERQSRILDYSLLSNLLIYQNGYWPIGYCRYLILDL